MSLTQQDIKNQLKQIIDPRTGKDIVSQNMVSSIYIKDNKIGFAIELQHNPSNDDEIIRSKSEELIKNYSNYDNVSVILTKQSQPQTDLSKDKLKAQKARPIRKRVENVKKIILVASGKGGVGKSTIATNIALKLSQNNKVAMVDSDIYGPSLSRMLGVNKYGKPEVGNNNKLNPIKSKYNIDVISMGNIIGEDVATIWRGPMTTKALSQLFLGTNWSDTDYMIVDTPPGTGDVHLSLAENFIINGVVIVTTPQDIATLDAKKAIDMYRKLNIPILGLVENMSYFIDDNGKKNYIFGCDGGKKLCEEHNIELLAQIPIIPEIRENADNGQHNINTQYFEYFNKLITKL